MFSSLDDLRYSIRNLLDQFGSTGHWWLGLAINSSFALLGAVVWYATDGLVAFAGAVWAILHVVYILKWAVRSL